MSKAAPKKRSLRAKTFRVILVVSLIMIMVGSGIGLALYAYASLHNYKSEARHLISYTMSMEDTAYLEKIFRETQEVYEALPEEVRRDAYSDAFEDCFRPLVDDDFFAARDILVKCREMTEQRNMFLMFTDPEHSAIVYVVDGDEEEWAYLPGQWLEADLSKLEPIAKSSWRLIITHEDEYGWIGTDCAPIRDTKGNFLGYAVMDLDLNDFLGRIFRFLIVLLPAAAAVILLLAFLSSGLLKRHIINHLTSMAYAAREYIARDKVAQSDDAPLVFESLDIQTADELEELCQSMAEMETDVRDTMLRLRQITAEQERMGAELAIATEIQTGMLPKDFAAFADRTEFELYASMEPAKEVGGDLYDFFMIDDDHLAMVIADVAGKGISAALFMVITKTILKNQTQQGVQDPADIFNHANLKLMEVNKARLFVTTWMGILEVSTGQVTYVNAGHEYPAIRRKSGEFALEEDVHCPPLAAKKRMTFESGSFVLHPGDTLFIYTDGVPEANNCEEKMFGNEGMLAALNQDPDADPEGIIQNVKESIAEFVQDADQFDDTTMLCIKYFG